MEVLEGGTRSAPKASVPLSAEGLQLAFGELSAVDDVSIEVARGEILALVGPNGAGKTTLLDLLSGFQRADAGLVRLAGRDVTRWAAHRRASAGLVRSFQDPLLFSTLTVEETVRISVAKATGARDRSIRRRAEELVTAVGLHPDQPAHELSQGMRRTLQLVCVAALRPDVLLLDEPSSGLATPEVEALAVMLRRFRHELGFSMVFVSHELPLVASVADRVAVMEEGRIVWSGGPAEMPVVGGTR